MPAARVVVVGSINADLIVRVPRIVPGGQTLTGADFRQDQGGKGANQATAASRLGITTVMVGCVGSDSFGDAALDALAADGVHVAAIARRGDTTGVAVVQVDDDGENAIVVVPGANALLDPAHVDRVFAGLAGSDDETVVILGLETPLDTAVHAAAAARDRGWRVLLNPAPAQSLPAELVGAVDVLVPNQHEVDELGFASVDAILAAGAGAVVVTRGADGSRIHTAGTDPVDVAAHRVDAVDTTGAGDAFIGTLATALARGSDLAEAVRLAAIGGALATRALGARASLATAAELDAASA